ncbi:MAG: alpha/beta hydrolase, partial [Acidimicrobiia bacterium]
MLATTGAAVVGTAPPASARGTLAWQHCGDRLECARLDVPVDAAVPDGEQVSLALIRAPAREPARRIGSLVVNYGGPGDAGTETLPLALDELPADIRDRFDVVSFDPRGTGGSRALDCVDDTASDALAAEDPTPDDLGELVRFYTGESSTVDVVGACVARFGNWLAEVGTRNVARDLDRIRIAPGDARLD